MIQFKHILTSVNLAFLVAALIFVLHGSSPTNADSRGWTINWYGVKGPLRFEAYCRPTAFTSWAVGGAGSIGNVSFMSIENESTENESLVVKKFHVPYQDTNISLYGVFFDSSGRGWVVGEKGSIFHTPNNGGTWIAQESGTKEILEDIVCVNERSCWILGGEFVYGEGFVLRTTDGGSTWQKIAKVVGRMIDFVDEKHGWIVDENLIYRTTNGGRKWTKVRIVPDADDEGRFKGRERDSVHFSTIRFVTPEVGWAAGGNMVARTDNGGKTWKISELDVWSEASIAGIVAHDNKTAMAVNKGEWNYCTEDAGKTWAKCFRRKDIPQADKTDQ
jgi:photosystem II stability/assembly factor-like uncharacterized protein